MHTMLLNACTSEEGKGTPVKVFVDYICDQVDSEAGTVTFKNGEQVKADMVIGADGIRVSLAIFKRFRRLMASYHQSEVRNAIGIVPDMASAPQTCFRCNVRTEDVKKLGLVDYSYYPSIQFWGGFEVPEYVFVYDLSAMAHGCPVALTSILKS